MIYLSFLHNYHKNDLSMSDYLASINHLCNCLAGCGQKIKLEGHKSTILNGLPPKYDHVVSIITTSQTPFDLQGIVSALLDVEAR